MAVDVQDPPVLPPTRRPLGLGVLAGWTAAAAGLATGELLAGVVPDASSPVVTVGNVVIDHVPRPVKDSAISLFGTGDKAALITGILLLTALGAAAVGVRSLRRQRVAWVGIAAFGLAGVLAVRLDDGGGSWAWVPPVGGAAVAWATLAALLRVHALGPPAGVVPARARGGAPLSPARQAKRVVPGEASADRRTFLVVSGGALVLSAGVAKVGRWLQGRTDAGASRAAVVLPQAGQPAAAVPATAIVDEPGISPFITPNKDFYRIDTALVLPQVATDGWTLKVHGMVDHEVTIDFEQLLARGLVEEVVTLACVSNGIGGDLVGTARWLGAPLKPILEEAGVHPDADQVVGRSADGFTAGFPVAVAMDGRPAMVAVGMNGEPLPVPHGFPARLIVPGLYGYVSATKWLTEIELTRFDAFDSYWVRRDWAAQGPIKLQSRIDVPRGDRAAGPQVVAGVAWAPTIGVDRVEVRVDDGDWHDAELADEVSNLTWRQWRWRWDDASPGKHTLTVRATDRNGHVQPEFGNSVFPDGAAGWHDVSVKIGG